MQRVTSASSARVAPFVRVGEGGEVDVSERPVRRGEKSNARTCCS